MIVHNNNQVDVIWDKLITLGFNVIDVYHKLE